jgi:CBS domain-containing protein
MTARHTGTPPRQHTHARTHARRLLLSKKIHRLPVVDGSGRLVGVLSRGNLVKAALAVRKAAAQAQQASSN